MTGLARQPQLPESKRRVLTLLRRHGASTKGTLAEHGQMGWSTVVKAVDELVQEGLVEQGGRQDKSPGVRGKYASLYRIAESGPRAIGVDVELHTTHIVLTNLKDDVILEERYPTPRRAHHQATEDFLVESLRAFMSKHSVEASSLAGIGIGILGIVFPTNHERDNVERAKRIASHLERVFAARVVVDVNSKVYALYEKWTNATFGSADFMLAWIRTGVALSIFQSGQLCRGTHGLAGEIGHMRVAEGGTLCRCGNTGCLETVVNQHYLAEQYRTTVRGATSPGEAGDVLADLEELFRLVKADNHAARRIVTTAGSYLGTVLAGAITVLDISSVVVSAHFGPDGDAIVDPISDAIRNAILPNVNFSVRYVPFDPMGHVLGAALLVLQDYLVHA